MNQKTNIYHIIRKDTINSTNIYAKDLLDNESCEDRTVVVADSQTAGKGQQGNKWESSAGDNLTLSLIYIPDFLPADKQFYISCVISLGIYDYLSAKIDNVSIKWPNDIYSGDSKIAGILIENTIMGNGIASSVCGMGININQEVFVSDAPNPVSLFQINRKKYKLTEELIELLRCTEKRYSMLERGEYERIKEDYFAVLYRSRGFYKFEDAKKVFEAKIKDVSDTGEIILETKERKMLRYYFKEVSFVISE